MMDEDRAKRAAALPANWWKTEHTCTILSQWFGHHLLPLFLVATVTGKNQHYFYTGFLLEHQGGLLWITAGHVIDNINSVFSSPEVTVRHARWADQSDIPGAAAIPYVHQPSRAYSGTLQGTDVGAMRMSYFEEQALRRNAKVEIMHAQPWANLRGANPEGFYIVGYPEEWVRTEVIGEQGNKTQMAARADIACLPVTLDDCDPDMFRGRIEPFPESADGQPKCITGMSGGPLVSIQRDPNGDLRCFLLGVQYEWVGSRREIHAIPIHVLAQRLGFLKSK